jgi:hypothetical protein
MSLSSTTHRIRPITAFVGASLVAGMIASTAPPAEARNRGKIRFARGASSKTVSSVTRESSPDCWDFGAEVGQRVSFRVTGVSVVGVFFFQDDPLFNRPDLSDQFALFGGRSSSETIGDEGPFRVCVAPRNSPARSYKLTLTIV